MAENESRAFLPFAFGGNGFTRPLAQPQSEAEAPCEASQTQRQNAVLFQPGRDVGRRSRFFDAAPRAFRALPSGPDPCSTLPRCPVLSRGFVAVARESRCRGGAVVRVRLFPVGDTPAERSLLRRLRGLRLLAMPTSRSMLASTTGLGRPAKPLEGLRRAGLTPCTHPSPLACGRRGAEHCFFAGYGAAREAPPAPSLRAAALAWLGYGRLAATEGEVSGPSAGELVPRIAATSGASAGPKTHTPAVVPLTAVERHRVGTPARMIPRWCSAAHRRPARGSLDCRSAARCRTAGFFLVDTRCGAGRGIDGPR